MIGMIAAVSKNGVIGIDNSLPFSYKEDMAHFRKMTADSTVIMGRKTFESLGSKPLPKRTNCVVTRHYLDCEGVKRFSSLGDAISLSQGDIWLIGGHRIYEEGMNFVDQIVLTITPDVIAYDEAVKFPWINPSIFKIESLEKLEGENNLKIATYRRSF